MKAAACAARLESAFAAIAAGPMAGLPALNRRLAVQAVDFRELGGAALGVLVTPWFMSLLRVPLDGTDAAPLGATRSRRIGRHAFDFCGAEVGGIGRYEAASLYSPMHEFADQAAATATAREVMRQLLGEAAPSRRALLFGARRPA